MFLTYGLTKWSVLAPDEPALICEGRLTTYAELRERVARTAGALIDLGTVAGDRIAILALNSDRAIEVMLGAIWGGRVASNLNLRWALPELVYAINDCQAAVLAVDKAYAKYARALRQQCPSLSAVLYIGEGEAPPGALSLSELQGSAIAVEEQNDNPHRMAILNYTGGTTGISKGVMISHAAFTHASAALQGDRFFLESQRPCLVTPLFHVTGLSMVLMNMAYGTPIIVLPTFEPVAAMRLFQEQRVTLTTMVPTMIQMLIEHPDFDSYDLSQLRYIRYGGSPVSEAMLRRIMEKLPQASLCQVYGQTEIMPLTVLRDEEHTLANAASGRLNSAGRPTPYVELFAVDDDGKTLPPGGIGEIVARGLNAMLGYWNKPELTAEVKDGWAIRTGDVGYFDEQGYLYLVDRKKDMIVSGGENVYSTEVEQALAQHPAVLACAVIARPDKIWGELVHACVVLHSAATATAQELQDHCRRLIAGYKVPRSFDFLDELPLTAAGKLNKVALREMVSAANYQINVEEGESV